MNTNMFNNYLDERLEGEDAADALFALLLREPPAELDIRIAELATLAIATERAEVADHDWLTAMDSEADALFAPLMLVPPVNLDSRILHMAHDTIEEEALDAIFAPLMVAPSFVINEKISEMAEQAIRPIFKDLWGNIVDILIDLFGIPATMSSYCAADAEEQTDLELLLHRPEGDCSLYTTVDQEDPSSRSVQLFFDGDAYEKQEVLLLKDNTVILHGIIKHGQIEAPLPVGVKIEPPFNILFRNVS